MLTPPRWAALGDVRLGEEDFTGGSWWGKMGLQSWGFSSEKKKEQNENRTSFDKYDQIGSSQYRGLWVLE